MEKDQSLLMWTFDLAGSVTALHFIHTSWSSTTYSTITFFQCLFGCWQNFLHNVCPFQLPKLLNPLGRKQVVVTAEIFCSLNAINSMWKFTSAKEALERFFSGLTTIIKKIRGPSFLGLCCLVHHFQVFVSRVFILGFSFLGPFHLKLVFDHILYPY